MTTTERKKVDAVVEAILERFREQGVDTASLDALSCCDEGAPVKVIAVTANVGQSLELMGRARRDQVVMVRVDEDAAAKLDAWVETGVVKSRSEAAALFIREGLQVRAGELSELGGALAELESARAKLRDQVRKVLGGSDSPTP